MQVLIYIYGLHRTTGPMYVISMHARDRYTRTHGIAYY